MREGTSGTDMNVESVTCRRQGMGENRRCGGGEGNGAVKVRQRQ